MAAVAAWGKTITNVTNATRVAQRYANTAAAGILVMGGTVKIVLSHTNMTTASLFALPSRSEDRQSAKSHSRRKIVAPYLREFRISPGRQDYRKFTEALFHYNTCEW